LLIYSAISGTKTPPLWGKKEGLHSLNRSGGEGGVSPFYLEGDMGSKKKSGYSQLECLVKVIEEIRQTVRPMGGNVSPAMEITADSDRWPPELKIAIGFSAEDLTQYIERWYPRAQCKARKPSDGKARSTRGQARS
jgi:hypothetical protein